MLLCRHMDTLLLTSKPNLGTRERDGIIELFCTCTFLFVKRFLFFFFLGTNFFSLSLISPNERKKKGGNEGKRKRKEPGFLEEQKIPHLLFDPDSSLPPSCFVCSFPITHCRTQPKKKKRLPHQLLASRYTHTNVFVVLQRGKPTLLWEIIASHHFSPGDLPFNRVGKKERERESERQRKGKKTQCRSPS